MTQEKISTRLSQKQLKRAKREASGGQADSTLGTVTHRIEAEARGEFLHVLIQDLIEAHGAPSVEDHRWAARALIA